MAKKVELKRKVSQNKSSKGKTLNGIKKTSNIKKPTVKKNTVTKNKTSKKNNVAANNSFINQNVKKQEKNQVVRKISTNVPKDKKIVKRIKVKKTFLYLIVFLIIIIAIVVLSKNNNKLEKNLKIVLNGDKDITIEYGESYDDLGATASYNEIDLTNKISIDTNVDFKKIGVYYYKYKITYDKLFKEVKRNVKIVDTKKPTITLNGSKDISIYIGSSYKESGAKATDNYDGDISKKVAISGSVNTKKTGTYTITYKVEDSSKNVATLTRTVKVIEKSTASNNKSTKSKKADGVIGKSSKGYTIERKNGLYYIGGVLVVNKTYDLPSTYNPGGLQAVFNTNFNKMKEAAKKDGVTLKVISGFRSYSYQKTLYNNYVKNDSKANADRYSARPGHSEHQTGLAADINKISYSWGETKDGKWLNDNCYKYGFVIRYPENGEDKTGYRFEPWHIRYLGVDIATKLYNNGKWITLEEYLGITSKYS